MLRADALFYVHEPTVDVQGIDLSKGGEHLSEFEADETRGVMTDGGIGFHDFIICLGGQSVALEDDWGAAVLLNHLYLTSVSTEVEGIPRLIKDEGARDIPFTGRFCLGDL